MVSDYVEELKVSMFPYSYLQWRRLQPGAPSFAAILQPAPKLWGSRTWLRPKPTPPTTWSGSTRRLSAPPQPRRPRLVPGTRCCPEIKTLRKTVLFPPAQTTTLRQTLCPKARRQAKSTRPAWNGSLNPQTASSHARRLGVWWVTAGPSPNIRGAGVSGHKVAFDPTSPCPILLRASQPASLIAAFRIAFKKQKKGRRRFLFSTEQVSTNTLLSLTWRASAFISRFLLTYPRFSSLHSRVACVCERPKASRQVRW